MRFAALAVLALGSACGGNVVVDGMPGEGSGGAGATSSSASGTSNVGVTSTGGGGGDARSKCLEYCEMFLPTCGAAPGSCGDVCDQQLSTAPACNDRLAPFFDCAIEAFNCDVIPSRCQPLLDEYDACAFGAGSGSGSGAGADCGGLECFGGGDRVCSCKGSCSSVDFAVECRPTMGGADLSCSCFVDGSEVASCGDIGPACDLARLCCEPIFELFR
ncbi:hypothetical protein BE04_08145 [Sorangium cellulosum]|uniref:Uncharacterized protein n=3 Tax=Sorangium cellulosum TaxID=56 RepID=A0A150Q0I4_SORCE|nr:hypothetical protein SCE1572_32250 [Sorangium cellulosum So0157-2]KYF61303.1 hypothetical protein BE04_08145 [Sorangium cellulosum]